MVREILDAITGRTVLDDDNKPLVRGHNMPKQADYETAEQIYNELQERGGPAYPCQIRIGQSSDVSIMDVPGMTLRDYFAGQALPYMARQHLDATDVARHSYAVADAMVAERDRQGSST